MVGPLSVMLMFAVAMPLFGVDVYLRRGGDAGAVGRFAVRDRPRGGDAHPQRRPVGQLTMLPLSFVSGIFRPIEGAPDVVVAIAHAFPLCYIADAFGACFAPQTTGGGWAPGHLAVIAPWGIVGLAVATRRFHAERGELAAHATA